MDSHTHGHHHGHRHAAPQSTVRLVWSIILNLVITIAEVVGGILSGSLALLSDALHNLSDTASLAISYGARKIARRQPDQYKTFGYRRAEIIGAFVNLIALVLISLYLIKEAVERFFDPQTIDGPIMLTVAVIGLLANVITALLLMRDARESINIRSAYLHIITDALSSVGVVGAGVLIFFYDVHILDPILTLVIACYILYHSYGMLQETVNILMEGVPADLDLDEVVRQMEGVQGVLGTHHLHAWQIDEHHTALEAHIVIDKGDLEHMEHIKNLVKNRLHDRFGIHHSTLEFEYESCGDTLKEHCFEQATYLAD